MFIPVCIMMMIMIIVSSYNGYCCYCCYANKIDAYDLLLGHWDTTIRYLDVKGTNNIQQQQSYRQPQMIEIFSNSRQRRHGMSSDNYDENSNNNNNDEGKRDTGNYHPWWNPRKRLRRWQQQQQQYRSVPYRLSLYSNGTFGLLSKEDRNNDIEFPIHVPKDTVSKEHVLSSSKQSTMISPIAIYGTWMIRNNPYCVTDRFYDNIILESYPRIQKKLVYRQTNSNKNDNMEYDISTIQKVQLKLHCRLYGHFTKRRGRRRRWYTIPFQNYNTNLNNDYFARGKLSHGTIVLERNHHQRQQQEEHSTSGTDSKFVTWYHRLIRQLPVDSPKIIASFTALRYIPTVEDLYSQSNHDEIDEL